MKLVLDTNCYISFLNIKNAEQHAKMISLWEKISRLEYEVILTSHNISEIVFVFKSIYSLEQNEINLILKDLLANPGVKYEAAYFPELTLHFWPKNIKDYRDAVLAATSHTLHANIVTFDQDFLKALRKINIQTFSI